MTSPVPQQQLPATDTAPVVPGAPVVKQTERPHPATPFIRGWLLFVAILLGWGRQLVPDGEEAQFGVSDLRWILPAIAGSRHPRRDHRLLQLVLHPLHHRRRRAPNRNRRDLQEVEEDPVRTAPVGRHHPTSCGSDLRSRRAAAGGRSRRQHHQAALPEPVQGEPAPGLSADPGPRAIGQHPRS